MFLQQATSAGTPSPQREGWEDLNDEQLSVDVLLGNKHEEGK